VPFNTGTNKLNPALGVESIAVELDNEKWLIPSGPGGTVHPQIAAWIDGMLYYAPSAHTSDYLMACWIAREGARKAGTAPRSTHLDLLRR
jgi:hypothetical protein